MFLPTTSGDLKKRGWDSCDIIIVTPDAYVDHPSFAMALLGRFLEKKGYRVGIISQPKWKDPDSFLKLGVPKIAFAVSGGQMDSMVLNYTATKLPRSEDLFCEDKNPFFSRIGETKYRIRPDRCVSVYCSQIRSVCKEKPIIIGGIEASLRRIAHYDYWSGKIRKSLLTDSKAGILIYGMGEYPLLKTIRAIEEGIPFEEMKIENTVVPAKESGIPAITSSPGCITLPSYEEIASDKEAFARAHILFEENSDENILVQKQDTRYIVQYPAMKLTPGELDEIYSSDFERKVHPSFKNVPAFEMIKTSVTSHRGCFGNCSFCALAVHQGKNIVSRSHESILDEIKKIAGQKDFSGTISDIGGPSANMYASSCKSGGCTLHDCLKGGYGCKNLIPGTASYLGLLKKASMVPGVKNIQVNSGIRFDPCILDQESLEELLQKYIPGQMKVAPESGSDQVLRLMRKPESEIFRSFLEKFGQVKKKHGLKKYVIPYIITGHPGEGEREAEETKAFLEKNRLSGRQFQVFTPTPMTYSTAMYYLGYDPYTGERLEVEKNIKKLVKRKNSLFR